MCPAPRPESGAHTQGGFSRRPGSEGCRSAVSSPWFLFCTESTKWKRKPPPGAPAAGCQGRSHLPTANVRPQGRRERVWCGRARVRAHPSVRPTRTAVAQRLPCRLGLVSCVWWVWGGRKRQVPGGRGEGREGSQGKAVLSVRLVPAPPPPPAWTSGPLIPPGGPGAPGSGPSSPSPLQTPGLSASMLRPTPPGPLHRRLAGALPTAWSPYCSLTHQQSFTDGSSKPGQGLSWCWIYKNKQSYPQGAPGSVGR